MTRSEHQTFDPSLYDADFYVWTQQQAAALRAMPRGADSAALDIDHVAEEIEDMGKRDLREVGSSILKLLINLLKAHCFPNDVRRDDWMSEASHARWWAADAYTPSMRELMDMDEIWRDFRKIVRPYVKDYTWPDQDVCPFTLDEVLCDDFDLHNVEVKLVALLPPAFA